MKIKINHFIPFLLGQEFPQLPLEVSLSLGMSERGKTRGSLITTRRNQGQPQTFKKTILIVLKSLRRLISPLPAFCWGKK